MHHRLWGCARHPFSMKLISLALLSVFSVLSLVCIQPSASTASPIYDTAYGRIKCKSVAGGLVHACLNVPFAQAPLGSLRWRAARGTDSLDRCACGG